MVFVRLDGCKIAWNVWAKLDRSNSQNQLEAHAIHVHEDTELLKVSVQKCKFILNLHRIFDSH